MLTRSMEATSVRSMKKQVSNLPLDAVLRAAKLAGQDASRNAVNAGRVVAGWKDGQIVEYGLGALPLSQNHREAGAPNDVGAKKPL